MLTLSKETLTELTAAQMAVVVGATGACTQTLPALELPGHGDSCFAASCITN